MRREGIDLDKRYNRITWFSVSSAALTSNEAKESKVALIERAKDTSE